MTAVISALVILFVSNPEWLDSVPGALTAIDGFQITCWIWKFKAVACCG
jgi:hypothetical protein